MLKYSASIQKFLEQKIKISCDMIVQNNYEIPNRDGE